jgi:hypothetical protein
MIAVGVLLVVVAAALAIASSSARTGGYILIWTGGNRHRVRAHVARRDSGRAIHERMTPTPRSRLASILAT